MFEKEHPEIKWTPITEGLPPLGTKVIVTVIDHYSRKLGFSKSTLTARINRYGWPIERALTETPTRGGNVRERR